MRFIVYGVGAVGGVIATALAHSGAEVIGVARGARLDAIRSEGLTLRSPKGTIHARFDGAGSAREIDVRPDDAILLVVKGQDTQAALEDLRNAGVEDQPVFCAQNGVANERTTLRYFPNVHGINVMLPAQYTEPGETIAWCSPNYGNFDIGRFPNGTDAADEALAQALTASGIGGYPQSEVMIYKYGKLIMNLNNIVEAALGRDVEASDLAEHLRAEGRAVMDAAGIAWRDVADSDPRRVHMKNGTVEGVIRLGGSTSQSLSRAAGSIETDYINGEISFLGRLNGIPTPANDFVSRLANRLARNVTGIGSITRDDLAREMGLT
ncbi:MAG: ketopantoate reductase family protein [Rhodobacter sp.]|nr:ketopantoate reductase family protein [Rhodobacter sp.]